MDRTAEFLRLVGTDDVALAPQRLVPHICLFTRAGLDQKHKLTQLRRRLHHDSGQSAAIQACQDQMAELESLVEDLSDLGSRMPQQPRDLLAHRRAIVSALYEELREMASRVQSAQVNQIQHEAEVAGYFTAAPRGESVQLKPPAASESLPDLPFDDRLKAEEQSLLTAFQSDLDQIQVTRTKIEEVSSLVGLFATKVAEQQEQVDQIHDLADQSVHYVKQAEEHLQKATQNSTSYRFYVVCWFVGAALTLLLIDFVDSRYSWI